MGITANNKSKLMCILTIVFCTVFYAADRLMTYNNVFNEKTSLIAAMIAVMLMLVEVAMISKSNDCFFAMLASLVCLKMVPKLQYLQDFNDLAYTIYYIASSVFVVLFVVMIIKFFKQQKENKISVLPVAALLFIVPFVNDIIKTVSSYAVSATGTKLAEYFISFALYSAAMVAILVVGYINGKDSMRFVSTFELVALLVNLSMRVGVIVLHLISSTHISKSYFVWCFIYAVFMVIFAIFGKKSSAISPNNDKSDVLLK